MSSGTQDPLVSSAPVTAIPVAPHALPLLGNLVSLALSPLRFLPGLADCGPLVRIRIGPASIIVLCDPDLTHEVLVHDRLYDMGGPIIERARDTLGNGLGTCPYSAHRRQRRLMQPAFHPDRLDRYAQVMVRQADQVISGWQPGQTLDVLGEMKKITSAVLISTMFSGAVPGPVIQQVSDDSTVFFAGHVRHAVLPERIYRLLPGSRAYLRTLARLRHTVESTVTDLRRRQHELSDDSLIAALLSARDEDGTGGLSDREITDQVATFLLVGIETTAVTLAWALHFIGQDPGLERRLHAEVDSVLAGRAATFQDLPRLDLTGRIITETLRMYPPGWLAIRQATAGTTLGGYAIPAGTTLAYSPFLIQHRPDLFPDPGRFDPDRWLPDRAAAVPRHATVYFGGGARKCIGDTFATTEATLALATIAARWRLLPAPRTRARPRTGTTLAPKGLRMRPQRSSGDHAKGLLGHVRTSGDLPPPARHEVPHAGCRRPAAMAA
jgi:cytochrome P450